MKYIPERLDRAGFWPWAVLLVLGHLLLSYATIAGAKLGALDTLAVLALSLVVGARFRDIGWPAWAGIMFMLLTMGLGPLGVAGYAIAANLPMAAFMTLMNAYGWIVGPMNLVLLIVAGSVPGRSAIDSAGDAIVQVFGSEGESELPPGAASNHQSDFDQMRHSLLVSAAVIAMLVGGGVLWIYARQPSPSQYYQPPLQSPQQAQSSPAQRAQPSSSQPAPTYAGGGGAGRRRRCPGQGDQRFSPSAAGRLIRAAALAAGGSRRSRPERGGRRER
ncbi:hypothetical protein [Bradyrhizobium sp. STM 3809]|uniref:hypothetical protein n=1 Tax=Bradyrhizobium sp. STM 3809 TaxID=551936 RepID=UPI001112B465|nr:hypothetical protein [Bradyrhizobium sp. STM 3809]